MTGGDIRMVLQIIELEFVIEQNIMYLVVHSKMFKNFEQKLIGLSFRPGIWSETT